MWAEPSPSCFCWISLKLCWSSFLLSILIVHYIWEIIFCSLMENCFISHCPVEFVTCSASCGVKKHRVPDAITPLQTEQLLIKTQLGGKFSWSFVRESPVWHWELSLVVLFGDWKHFVRALLTINGETNFTHQFINHVEQHRSSYDEFSNLWWMLVCSGPNQWMIGFRSESHMETFTSLLG